ncbi:serine hydrolase domain-containing protein [Paenibacillus shunpengii]|uniref:Serine hydrolase domain-containing protein n=1 Tax=Paenibacillus shunpengii TaxID=2054424 RepID=A0ABW5SIX3_9BACL|nr:serine hydrolase domain-containing protein [Paenibacillus sp. PDC88]SDX45506.1 beta-lactamase class C [Paenibacillus sp. PDC88]
MSPFLSLTIQNFIDSCLESYYAKHKEAVLVIGTVYRNERRVYGIGDLSPYPTSEYSRLIYEIGSITKLFTVSLLAQLHYDGFLTIDESLGQYVPLLPPDSPVTFKHLATHTSGLPSRSLLRETRNLFDTRNSRDPYSAFSLSEAAFYLRKISAKEAGIKYQYSNAGMGLLGHVLATELQTTYELAVQDGITIPLQMQDTAIHLSSEARERLVPGYTGRRRAAKLVLQDFPGTGAFRSSISDLLTFLSVHMGLHPDKEMTSIYSITQQLHFQKNDTFGVGLGWFHQLKDNLIWHNGGTHGYMSFMGFLPEQEIGVVVLSNKRTSSFAMNPTHIGMELLRRVK